MATLRAENSGGAAVSSLQAGAALHPVDLDRQLSKVPAGTGCRQCTPDAAALPHLNRKNCPTNSLLSERYTGDRALPAIFKHPSTCGGRAERKTQYGWVDLCSWRPGRSRKAWPACSSRLRHVRLRVNRSSAGNQASLQHAVPHVQQRVAALEEDLDGHAKQRQLVGVHACTRVHSGNPSRCWRLKTR